jgi:hypothetical protein
MEGSSIKGGFFMKIGLILGAVLALCGPAVADPPQAKPQTSAWTGYVTDTHCGARGAVKDHTVACVEKCMKAGSKAQILNDADKKIYNLDSFDKVRGLMGHRVTVTGTYDEPSNTITVASAAKADQ